MQLRKSRRAAKYWYSTTQRTSAIPVLPKRAPCVLKHDLAAEAQAAVLPPYERYLPLSSAAASTSMMTGGAFALRAVIALLLLANPELLRVHVPVARDTASAVVAAGESMGNLPSIRSAANK